MLVFGFGVFAAAPAGMAQPAPPLAASPPATADPAEVHVVRIQLAGSPPETPTCPAVYDNTVNFTGLYHADQGGDEVMDDLHLVEGGALCSFAFGYNQPGAPDFQAVITFYANDGQDLPPWNVVAGPYVVTGLPQGSNAILVAPPDSPLLGRDLWMGVRFSSPSAGLLISDPPVVGSSHDYFYENPPGDYFYYGGSPRANFYMRIEAESAVPTERGTWGELKARHP